jgi:hypothetical protein
MVSGPVGNVPVPMARAALQQRSFDQDDVAPLQVTARDYTATGIVFRELEDFLAHPDQKDRGLVIRAIQDAAPKYDHFLKQDHKNLRKNDENDWNTLPAFNGVISPDQLIGDLIQTTFTTLPTRRPPDGFMTAGAW